MDYLEIIKNISTNLKELRKKTNKTQEQLIDEIGELNISLRTYKSYESGSTKYVPSLDKLSILASYFNVTIDSLISNRKTTYDDSFSKIDNLKRLAILIHCLALRPIKCDDPNNQYYGKYYFVSFDNDLHLYIDEYERIAKEKNFEFEYEGKPSILSLDDMINAIYNLKNLDEDWSLTLNRFNYLLLESGLNPEEYAANHYERIAKRRKVHQQKNENKR